jgi:hypothetical protein
MLTMEINKEAVAIVASCLGSSEDVAREVASRMYADPRRAKARDPVAFERLAWLKFSAYRREAIGAGADDPMWDLTAPSPVEVSEGGRSDG